MSKTPTKTPTKAELAKELELKRLKQQMDRLKQFAMNACAYIGVLVGIIADQMFPDISFEEGTIDATISPLKWPQILGALIVSTLLFHVIERKGDVLGKNKNIGRIIRTAFFMGFFWNQIIGRIFS